MKDFRHHTPIQIRFNDVDVLGHVNNTVYFSFYDTGKAMYFADVNGFMPDWKKVDRIIANVNCAFINPIRFGEQIEVLTRCIAVGNKSFTLEQVIQDSASGQIKSTCTTVMVTIDPVAQTSLPVPDALRSALEAFEQHPLPPLSR